MKREIKFRAWDNVNNKMITAFSGINWSNNITSGKILDTYNSATINTPWKDRNGKDIFIGDIVEGVWYCGDFMRCEVKQKETGEFVFCKLGTIGHSSYEQHFIETCEVIGNIYENPELLK